MIHDPTEPGALTRVAICGRISSGNRLSKSIVEALGLEAEIFHGTLPLPSSHEHQGPANRRSVEAFLSFVRGHAHAVLIPRRDELIRRQSELRHGIHDWLRAMRLEDPVAWSTEEMERRIYGAIAKNPSTGELAPAILWAYTTDGDPYPTGPGIVHVDYAELVASPLAVIHAMAHNLGVEVTAKARALADQVRDENAKYAP